MTVRLDLRGSIATLTFDDPARKNVMTPELGDALETNVASLRKDPNVRAVVLTGAHGAFSSGGDLKMLERLRTMTHAESKAFMLGFYKRFLSVLDLEVPIIAAIEGAAIGAGFCVALACDVCIVDQSAKLALNFAQLGLHPGMGATYFVPRRAGAARAFDLLTTGRRFSGSDAVSYGLALEALPAAEVLARAQELAKTIAASGPLAVKGLKRTLGLNRHDLQRALDQEAEEQALSYASADLGEGLAAAAARRAPVFKGN